jgi:peptide-methionine (R)-S-oxide reductase
VALRGDPLGVESPGQGGGTLPNETGRLPIECLAAGTGAGSTGAPHSGVRGLGGGTFMIRVVRRRPKIELVTQTPDVEKIEKSDKEWKAELSPEQYEVLRKKGTEPAWTGTLLDVHDPGLFRCAACGEALFRSDDKFDSGSGWPSFTQAAADGTIEEHRDLSHGMLRTEVTCAKCGGHLGHVFPDGPNPTGLRYCINSLSLEFDPAKADEAESK